METVNAVPHLFQDTTGNLKPSPYAGVIVGLEFDHNTRWGQHSQYTGTNICVYDIWKQYIDTSLKRKYSIQTTCTFTYL